MISSISSRIRRALSPMGVSARVFAAVALVGVATAACDVHGVTDLPPLATLTISPSTATLAPGGTQQFTALGRDASGATVSVTPTWTVSTGGGTISGAGLLTAGTAAGNYTVTATSGSVTATASVTVTPGAATTITVTPNPANVVPGGTQQFTAVGKDAGGNTVTITPVWSVTGGGTISTTGLFTAGATTGTSTVTAAAGTLSGTATVNVAAGALATLTITPNPASVLISTTRQFTVVGKDAGGNVITTITPAVVWSVPVAGGTVNATGLFTASATPGTYNLTATSGTITGTSVVTVTATAGALTTITVTPASPSIAAGTTRQFTAVGTDASGNVVTISPAVVWSIGTAGGGTISSTGLFTAGATAGTFANTIVATSGTISGNTGVTITAGAGALSKVTVTPNPASVAANGTQQFTAVGTDAAGNVVTITPAVTWSVATVGGGTISATGLYTAGAATGTFTDAVIATSGTLTGKATVTITAAATGVNLGTAAPNGIMAGTAVTCVSGGTINANVSISPGNTITGFGPCTITGVQNLGNAIAAQGQTDLTAAYNTLAGLPCPPANAIVANLGGTTKPAGVYCTASGIGVTGTLTLDGGGDPNATFVFQAGSSLTTAGNVVLIGGAQAKNVYWQVGSSATLGTGSAWQGNILALTSITLNDTATLNGRALARNGAVTLGTNNTITLP